MTSSMVTVSPSASLSFARTSIRTEPSSATVAESGKATGSSLATVMMITGSTVTVTVAMLLSPSSTSTTL